MTAVKNFKQLPNLPFLQTEKDMVFTFIVFVLVLFFKLTHVWKKQFGNTEAAQHYYLTWYPTIHKLHTNADTGVKIYSFRPLEKSQIRRLESTITVVSVWLQFSKLADTTIMK